MLTCVIAVFKWLLFDNLNEPFPPECNHWYYVVYVCTLVVMYVNGDVTKGSCARLIVSIMMIKDLLVAIEIKVTMIVTSHILTGKMYGVPCIRYLKSVAV